MLPRYHVTRRRRTSSYRHRVPLASVWAAASYASAAHDHVDPHPPTFCPFSATLIRGSPDATNRRNKHLCVGGRPMKKHWTSSLVLAVAVGGLAVVTSAAGSTPAAPPTSVSSRYVVVGNGPVLEVGNTVYVGGVSRIEPRRALRSSSPPRPGRGRRSRLRSPAAPYRRRPRRLGRLVHRGHVHERGRRRPSGPRAPAAERMLDTAFVPPKLGQVRALALDAGRL